MEKRDLRIGLKSLFLHERYCIFYKGQGREYNFAVTILQKQNKGMVAKQ
jgi:hypothetical protein